MRMLKRVAWFCFAGCCCAGLMLTVGERSQQTKVDASDNAAFGSASYCPKVFYGQIGEIYYYGCVKQGVDCAFQTLYYVGVMRMYTTGDCPSCPDPMSMPDGHPVLTELDMPTPVPQPDPMFSGILR